MKNIERKVSLKNFRTVMGILRTIGARHVGRLSQKDIYFACPIGRLKLREIDSKKFFLIFYKRADKKGSKISNYSIWRLGKKEALNMVTIFGGIFGKKIVVIKTRNLWIYGKTRIHLDSVRGLGKFLELETVLKNTDEENGMEEHKKLISALNLSKYRSYKQSYADIAVSKKTKNIR